MQAEYTTLADYGTDEFVEKRSRFIGYAKPVTTEEEAIAFINEIRAQHREASHNVYAYALREGQVRRYSDDGEPQGTAGIPVLDVLQKSGIVDAGGSGDPVFRRHPAGSRRVGACLYRGRCHCGPGSPSPGDEPLYRAADGH